MHKSTWRILLGASALASMPMTSLANDLRGVPLAAEAFQHICVPVLERGKDLNTLTETLSLPQTGVREASHFLTMRWFWPDTANPEMNPAPSIHVNAETDLDDKPLDCTLIYDVHETPITREQAADSFAKWVATQPQFEPLHSQEAGLSSWRNRNNGLFLRASSSYMEGGLVISYGRN